MELVKNYEIRLLWVDQGVRDASNQDIYLKLKEYLDDCLRVENVRDAYRAIKRNQRNFNLVVTSGSLGQPLVHQLIMEKINFNFEMFIYCSNIDAYKKWKNENNYQFIKGVISNPEEFSFAIFLFLQNGSIKSLEDDLDNLKKGIKKRIDQTKTIHTNRKTKSYYYQHIKTLSSIGSIHTFQSYNSEKKKDCVVKTIYMKDFQINEAQLLEDFEEINTKIKHAYICKLTEFFYEAKILYLVMEKAGSNLNDKIKDLQADPDESSRLAEITLIEKFHDLVRALSFCHNRQIIHRNIKLSNILIDKSLGYKLSDFTTEMIFRKFLKREGYPYPPEIMAGKDSSKESDIWNLGVCFLEIFELKTREELKDMIISKQYSNHYSSDLNKLIKRMTDDNPTSRPQIEEVEGIINVNNFLESLKKIKKKQESFYNSNNSEGEIKPRIEEEEKKKTINTKENNLESNKKNDTKTLGPTIIRGEPKFSRINHQNANGTNYQNDRNFTPTHLPGDRPQPISHIHKIKTEEPENHNDLHISRSLHWGFDQDINQLAFGINEKTSNIVLYDVKLGTLCNLNYNNIGALQYSKALIKKSINVIYFVGGRNAYNQTSKNILMLNISKSQIEKITEMKYARESSGALLLNENNEDIIIVAGGKRNDSFLGTCEKINLNQKELKRLPSLTIKRENLGLAKYGNDLYCFGGKDKTVEHKIIKKLANSYKKWEEIKLDTKLWNGGNIFSITQLNSEMFLLFGENEVATFNAKSRDSIYSIPIENNFKGNFASNFVNPFILNGNAFIISFDGNLQIINLQNIYNQTVMLYCQLHNIEIEAELIFQTQLKNKISP